MLLAVALALLVAQSISAVLIYRGDQQRREARLINTLALQMVVPERRSRAEGWPLRGPKQERRAERRDERRQQRLAQILENSDAQRETEREAALTALLERQEIAVSEVFILRRPIPLDLRNRENMIGRRAIERAPRRAVGGVA